MASFACIRRWRNITRVPAKITRRAMLALGCFGLGVSLDVHAQLSGVVDARANDAGAIEGVLMQSGYRPAAGVTITVLETGQQATTDQTGLYRLVEIAPGTYTLTAKAEGYQRLHITDVVVRPNRSLLLSPVELQKPMEGVTELEPYVVKGQPMDVTRLDEYLVRDRKPLPFSGWNVDLPRGIDDPQPYYIFDAATIEQSGATTVEDFFRLRVPMNVQGVPNSATNGGRGPGSGSLGGTSTIDLNGFGPGYTLILVNGRRMPGLSIYGSDNTVQPDLNGLPLAAIERIEILPASASGIYGGNAVGGVVNIILRQDYVGAQLRLNYENTYDTDASTRSASLTAGASLENGRTHVNVTLSHRASDPLLYQDRLDLLKSYRDRVRANDPAVEGTTNRGPLGATPNIRATDFSGRVNGQFVFIPAAPLFGPGTAMITHVPAGYAGGGGVAPFLPNAGRYNLDIPPTSQSDRRVYGLRYPLGGKTQNDSVLLSVRRDFLPALELFTELEHRENQNWADIAPHFLQEVVVPATAPTNPFGTAVAITGPLEMNFPQAYNRLKMDRAVAGFKLKLPGRWIAEGDYSFGRNDIFATSPSVNVTRLNDDAASGTLDLFRDLLAHPPSFTNYRGFSRFTDATELNTANLRIAGPIWTLPAGDIMALASGGYQKNETKEGRAEQVFEVPDPRFQPNEYPRAAQKNLSGYAELQVPLFSERNARPGLAALDVQLSGRVDENTVGDDPVEGVTGPTGNRHRAFNQTVGVRYRPVRDVMLRASYGTAFQPPAFDQLRPMQPVLWELIQTNPFLALENPTGWLPSFISDPKRGGEFYQAPASIGGNPKLRPEEAENFNAGIVLEPRFLPGLRLSVDYVRVEKSDDIGILQAQVIVDQESSLSERVTRADPTPGDPFGVGRITFIDGRFINLFRTFSSSYNIALNYHLKTATTGTWNFHAMVNSFQHYRVQTEDDQPMVEKVANPTQSDVRQKFAGSIGISWAKGPWSAGWTTRVQGARRLYQPYVKAQGGTEIARQIFHDVFAGYRFGEAGAGAGRWQRALSRTSLQIGAKNVFNTAAAFDASANHYYSHQGTIAGGVYYISFGKEF